MIERVTASLAAIIGESLPRDRSRIAAAARRLSLAFTSERETLPENYFDDPQLLAAYVAAFLVPNVVKAAHVLSQAEAAGLIPQRKNLRVLDLGAGPGTATLAASLVLAQARPGTRVLFHAAEQNHGALRTAEGFFRRIAAPPHALELIRSEIQPKRILHLAQTGRFDIIIAANLLNEVDSAAAEALVRMTMTELLARDGVFIVIDPALREGARRLMQVRDRLLADGVVRVAAPCLHERACPMLAAGERDWCHFYIDWQRPAFLAELDQLSGMDHRHLKMSYLVLQPAGVVGGANHESRVTNHGCQWRTVSSPLITKGKREVWLCGSAGTLCKVRRTDRDASDANRDFDAVKRGDVVECNAGERVHCGDRFSLLLKWQK